jgi:hypothetical protein
MRDTSRAQDLTLSSVHIEPRHRQPARPICDHRIQPNDGQRMGSGANCVQCGEA